ncbi:MAG: hypothetical protein KJO87_08075, partial [Acidimicrobiia bacterium]|nr:hypothetical protein [Acidimicrobiia bacterium]
MIQRRLLAAVSIALLGVGAAWLVTSATDRADARVSNRAAGVGVFDPTSGSWQLRDTAGVTRSFFYGVPGDLPLLGDWDCDGEDTVGMYRPSTGFVYLRNSNSFGVADLSFYFGIPGDIPFVGDWNGNGCDTLAIYRSATVFLSNALTTGPASDQFFFGIPGDRPFAGDFDGNGTTDFGLHRPGSGFVYYATGIPAGSVAETAGSFYYGIPGDRVIAGDWDLDSDETVGLFRSSEERFYLRNDNSLGVADVSFSFGSAGRLPVAGDFALSTGTTTTLPSTTTTVAGTTTTPPPTTTTTLPATTTTLPPTTTTTTTMPPTTTTLPPTTTTTAGGGPLTLMAVGDSITQGSAGWRTYRCALDGKLDGAGASFDLVGGLSSPNGGGSYSCPSPFDQDHEGRWGQRVDEVTGAVVASVQSRQPDVVLIHLGTNDILQGQGPAGTASELQSLIGSIQGANPDVTIFVAQIIPCDPVGGGGAGFGSKCTADLPALNDAIG